MFYGIKLFLMKKGFKFQLLIIRALLNLMPIFPFFKNAKTKCYYYYIPTSFFIQTYIITVSLLERLRDVE